MTRTLLYCIHIFSLTVLCGVINAQVATQEKPGRLTGVIRDDNNQPIAGASIAIDKKKGGTTTSVTGDYVLSLPPGTYTIVISAVNYEARTITDVIIKANEQSDLSVTLAAGKSQSLTGVTVSSTARRESARGLLLVQKNSSSMTDGISSEIMAKLPDPNIAKVLKRVSGLTVQGEKFVTIRGISDRYINVMINGSILPSTEPNRRNFSFDIIPSALVDNVIVNKTATPDLSGEFTGGIVQVFTKDVPVKNFLQVTLGTGINTASFDKPFNSFERDKKANLGKINADRLWFGDGRLLDPVVYVEKGPANSSENIRGQIPNAWRLYRYGYNPVQNYQVSGGISKRFSNNNSLGVIGAFTYLNEMLSEEGELANSGSAQYANTRNKYNTSLGALLNVAYKTRKHKLSWKNLYNLRYSDQYDEKQGINYNFPIPLDIRTNVTLQNKLFQTRVEGEHLLTSKNLKLDWSADNIQLDREQPHTRGLLKLLLSENAYGYDYVRAYYGLFGLFSAVLNENKKTATANLSIPFSVKGSKQSVKLGYAFTRRSSDLNSALFYIISDSISRLPQGTPYYDVATQENFRNGLLTFRQFDNSTTTTGDGYNGIQDLHAAYAMVDLRLLKKLRLIGGVRNEKNNSTVSTLFYLYPGPGLLEIKDTTKKYTENDWLPSANLIYSLTSKINIRTAFSKTIARPELIERSPYLYNDIAEQLTVTGQKALEISRINNYDFRFEFYPTPGEILSFSAFYKKFDKPVERIYLIDGTQPGIQYRNMKSAKATGFELDFRKSLSFVSPASRLFRNLTFSGNFSYINGKVVDLVTVILINPYRDSSYEVNADRPLQGLSPYIINAGLSYDDTSWGFNIAYNKAGRRNLTGGANFLVTQYENPRNLLDIQVNGKFFKRKLELKLNISDLLNEPFIIYSNSKKQNSADFDIRPNDDPRGDAYNEKLDYINYKVKKGVGLSVNATYKF